MMGERESKPGVPEGKEPNSVTGFGTEGVEGDGGYDPVMEYSLSKTLLKVSRLQNTAHGLRESSFVTVSVALILHTAMLKIFNCLQTEQSDCF